MNIIFEKEHHKNFIAILEAENLRILCYELFMRGLTILFEDGTRTTIQDGQTLNTETLEVRDKENENHLAITARGATTPYFTTSNIDKHEFNGNILHIVDGDKTTSIVLSPGDKITMIER